MGGKSLGCSLQERLQPRQAHAVRLVHSLICPDMPATRPAISPTAATPRSMHSDAAMRSKRVSSQSALLPAATSDTQLIMVVLVAVDVEVGCVRHTMLLCRRQVYCRDQYCLSGRCPTPRRFSTAWPTLSPGPLDQFDYRRISRSLSTCGLNTF